MAGSSAWLLDVREADEWAAGHAAEAHHLPLSEFQQRSAEIPVGERIIVICHSGARSERVTRVLVDAGFDAANVIGGMMAWQSAGGVVVTDLPEAPHA